MQIYTDVYFFHPKEYLDLYFKHIKAQNFDDDMFTLWTKNLRGEATQEENEILYNKLSSVYQTPKMYRATCALQQAELEVLNEACEEREPKIFTLDFDYISTILAMLLKEENFPTSYSSRNSDGSEFEFTIYKKPDISKISRLFKKYNRPAADSTRKYLFKVLKKRFIEPKLYESKPQLYNFVVSDFRAKLNTYADTVGACLDYMEKHPYAEETKYMLESLEESFSRYYTETTKDTILKLVKEKGIDTASVCGTMERYKQEAMSMLTGEN